jgi:flagella basal body P-ring formation protein FlgA
MTRLTRRCLWLAAFALFICAPFASARAQAVAAAAAPAPALALRAQAQVSSAGIFLSDLCAEDTPAGLPRVRLADAPPFGQTLTLTRAQISEGLRRSLPELAVTKSAGAEQVRVTRRSRTLGETELKELLTAQLQRDHVGDKGELELRFTRSWPTLSVPDEPLSMKILDLPATGISPNFIVRFQLVAAGEALGPWQMALQAKVWREVLVAGSALVRGQLFSEADLARERRDVLLLRDLLPEDAAAAPGLELTEQVRAGSPLYARSVRQRPVVRRGQFVEAVLQDGALVVSMKVEVLENGVPGQIVRVRNLQSRREFRGKVQNEQTVLVSL